VLFGSKLSIPLLDSGWLMGFGKKKFTALKENPWERRLILRITLLIG